MQIMKVLILIIVVIILIVIAVISMLPASSVKHMELPMPPLKCESHMPKDEFSYSFVKILYNAGYSVACGIPGSSTLFMYKQLEQNNRWLTFMTRDERTAGFIANGTCRPGVNGELALAFGTSGPGSTNLMTPMAEAKLEYLSSLYIVNDVGASDGVTFDNVKNRYIQDIEPEDMFGKIAKKIYRIEKSKIEDGTVTRELYEAFKFCRTWPQGPLVLVVTAGSMQVNNSAIKNVHMFKSLPRSVKPSLPIVEISHGIENAERPLVVIGNGCRDSIHEILDHLDAIGIPYVFSLPMSGYMRNSECNARFMGHLGSYTGNMTSLNADWVCVLGCSLDGYLVVNDETVFPNARGHIYNINAKPENYIVDFATTIRGDASSILSLRPSKSWNSWIAQIHEWRAEEREQLMNQYWTSSTPCYNYGTLMKNLDMIMDQHENVHLLTDTGVHQLVVRQLMKYRDMNFITPYKLACVGSGWGNAIGVSLANWNNDIDELIVLVSGDGGMLLNQNDLVTMRECSLVAQSKFNRSVCQNILVVVVENSGLGLISQEALASTIPDLRYANGYYTTVDWHSLMKAAHLNHRILTNRAMSLCTQLPCVNVVMMEHDRNYAPLAVIGTSLSEMQYNEGGHNSLYTNYRVQQQLKHS